MLRSIKSSFSRFAAIFAITALGVGFLAGLMSTTPDMRRTIDHYYDSHDMMDIYLKSTYGFNDDDIAAVRNTAGVADAMPHYVTDVMVKSADDSMAARIYGYDYDRLNIGKLTLIDGRYPEKADEVLCEEGNGITASLEIGDKVTITGDAGDTLSDTYSETELTVVGIVMNPYYMSAEREGSTKGNGRVGVLLYGTEELYLPLGVFTDIYVTAEGAKELDTYSDQYDELIADLTAALEATGKDRAEIRFSEIKSEAEEKLADAKSQIAENEQKLADGEKAISDAETEISENEKKIADGEKEYADGLADYNEAKETADREFADAERKINDAKDEISKLKKPEWYVLDRSKTMSFASFDSNADKIAAIAKVFPLFFFLVAALVAQTTMTRLIEEERGQIGILKALGYSKSDIMMKYVIYAGIPGIFGSACGLAAGLFVFPSVVWNAYKIMYRFPTLEYSFIPSIALGASAAAVACILLSTVWAGAHSLAETPAALLLPRAPKAGKRVLLERVGFIWKRLGFNSKVTIRNIFRYKKRFFMTTIGIGGCTALLLTGFGLRNSIGDIVSKQFEDLMRYNLTIDLNSQTEDLDRLDAFLTSDRTDGSTLIHSEYGKVISGKDTVEAYFRVPELADDYAGFQILRERKSKKPLTLDDDSVILTEKMASILGVSVGDNVTLENEDGLTADFRVGGIAENYVMSYVYMTSDLYTSGFGTEPDYNVVLVKSNADAAGEDAETEELLGMKCVSSVSFTTSMSSSFENMLGKIDYIVIVLIISAGALVFVVLYNLTNINIAERSKELATIKVLGFFDGEVAGYVYREIAALSVIGTLFGLFAGIFLHKFVVVTAEVDSFMFGRSIYPSSFLISALITLVFSALVCLFMLKKLNGIDMVESMKGGE